MKRVSAILAVFALIGLGACGSLGRVATPRNVVDFGPPVEALAQNAHWPDLGIEVRAPVWFDSLGVQYRLAYANVRQLHDYAETRWAGAPTQLVAQRLRQRLRFGSAAGSACSVQVVLDEFSQIFDSPENSRGVLRGTATLIDRRGAVLARTPLAAEAGSATADARGGVTALTEAVDRSAATLGAWLADTSQQGRLTSCAG